MKKRIFVILLLFFNIALFSEDIEVKVYSNKSNVSENSIFKISIEVSNANNFEFAEDPVFDPSMIHIKSEQSMNMSIINGRYSSSYILTMYLKATKKGKYKIGPFKIKVKNSIYTTNEIEITVDNEQTSKSDEFSYSEDENPFKNRSREDKKEKNLDYILDISVSKKEVFVYEGIDISVDLYVRNQLQTINYTGLKLPSNAWVESLESKDNYAGRVVLNGLYYEHYIIEKKRVFIPKEGLYEIPSVVYNFYGFSGSSFFYFTEPMSLQTEPVSIKVKPLPLNAPESFKGAVGDFKINYLLDPKKLKTKESANFIIFLEGEGNFHNIKEIGFKIEGDLEQYSSTQDIKSGNSKYKTKKWETLLVPTKPGKHKIIVNEFSFFNLITKSYMKIPKKEFELNVESSGDEKEREQLIIFNNQTEVKKDIVVNDIGYVRTGLGIKNNIFNYSLWAIVIVSIYVILLLYIGLFVFFKYSLFSQNRNREAFRKKYAYKEFLNDMNKLSKHRGDENINDLVDKIYKSIEKYFVWKYGIKSVEFTSKGISELLAGYLKEESINKLKDYILHIDMVRFGGIEYSKEEFEKLINEIKSIIKSIEG